MDNIQKKIGRVRTPRVQITYDLETNGSKILKKLPYIVAIIADVIGDSNISNPYKERRLMNMNGSNLSNIMESLDVRLKFSTPSYLSDNPNNLKAFDIPFVGVDSFHPDTLIENIPDLLKLKTNLFLLRDMKRKLLTNDKALKKILESILNKDLIALYEVANDSDNQNSGEKVETNKSETKETKK